MKKLQKGFTLIELLVVISIIGILAGMTMVSYTGAQKQTRDTQRRSDLAQYRNGIESFATNNSGLYPRYSTRQQIATSALCTLLKAGFISACPADPIGATNVYYYQSDGAADDGAGVATKYVLWVTLETDTSSNWTVCSDGRSAKVPIFASAAGGVCPIP